MDFVRRHLFYLICGVVAVGGVALGVTGLRGMPRVHDETDKVSRIYRDLEGLKSVNRDRLDAERRRIVVLTEDREKVFARAKELYGYEPLVPDVLPDGEPNARLNFRTRYGDAMEALIRSLNYGAPAAAMDIAHWRDRIADELARQKDEGLDRGATAPSARSTGPPRTPAGVLTRAGALTDAVPRAHMAAAQRAYCYAVHFRDPQKTNVPSLDFHDAMQDRGTLDAPELDDIWQAQLSYWIQKDVVDAIVSVNQEAADEAEKNGEDAWLGIMPVKELISVRVFGGFVFPEGGAAQRAEPGGPDEAWPTGSSDAVFTQSESNEWYEVAQFTVKAIMDQRDIPRLVDRLSRDSFHTLLRVAYEAVPPNKNMVGKIYGSEPTVAVVLDFEMILLGDVFRPLMPQSICDDYGIPCPAREEEGE